MLEEELSINIFSILSAGFMNNSFLVLKQDWVCSESNQLVINNGIREKGLLFVTKRKVKLRFLKLNEQN